MSGIQAEDGYVPEQLVEQLVKGYDSLAYEFKRVHEQHRELENKLSWAKQQYLDALKRFTPATASKEFYDFLEELDEAGACQKEGQVDWLAQLSKSNNDERRTRAYNIQQAEDVRSKIGHPRNTVETSTGVRIWGGKSADPADGFPIEQDFTTSGTPGRLGCPFVSGTLVSTNGNRSASTPRSSMSKVSFGRRSKRHSFHDPIKADMSGVNPMSSEASVEGSMPLCPIRFLDQHSPEEVARYFEKHKHELPKSHEICVKRFQENEDVVRQLDSKYANVVSMVKDLGQMHKPMLPKAEDVAMEGDDDEDMQHSTSKVERWAEAIGSGDDGQDEHTIDDGDEREQRFDRSLTDIRVGESPSRPWGISVPDEYKANGDAGSRKSDPTASPLESESKAKAVPLEAPRCPFGGMMKTDDKKRPTTLPAPTSAAAPHKTAHIELQGETANGTRVASNHPVASEKEPPGPQMVFNGPVFFGYPIDQAMAMLKQSGLSG